MPFGHHYSDQSLFDVNLYFIYLLVKVSIEKSWPITIRTSKTNKFIFAK